MVHTMVHTVVHTMDEVIKLLKWDSGEFDSKAVACFLKWTMPLRRRKGKNPCLWASSSRSVLFLSVLQLSCYKICMLEEVSQKCCFPKQLKKIGDHSLWQQAVLVVHLNEWLLQHLPGHGHWKVLLGVASCRVVSVLGSSCHLSGQ